MDTPEGRARLEAYEERVDQAISDRREPSHQDETPQPRSVAGGAEGHAQERCPRIRGAADEERETSSLRQPHPRDSAVLDQSLQPSAPQPDGPWNQRTDFDDDDEDNMEVDHDENIGFFGRLEPSSNDYASELLLQQLGSSGRSYR